MTQTERNAALDAEMTLRPGLFGGSYAEWRAAQPAEFIAEWYATLATGEIEIALAANDNSVITLGIAANDNADAPRVVAA